MTMDEQFDISDLISSLELGVEVFVLSAKVEGNGTFKVVVDTENGINIGGINRIAKKLRNDEGLAQRLGSESFRLEVTSPGANAELIAPWQFRRHVGRTLKVFLKSAEPEKPIIGDLVSIEDEGLNLALEAGEQVVAWDQIEHAKIKLKW